MLCSGSIGTLCRRQSAHQRSGGFNNSYFRGSGKNEVECIYIENLTAVTAEKERIGAELNVATEIQASMLPCFFPAFPDREEFDIYTTMTPAKEVGGDVFTEVNQLLCESESGGMFITAFEGVLDLVTGELRFVNAGHERPFLCKNGGADGTAARPIIR